MDVIGAVRDVVARMFPPRGARTGEAEGVLGGCHGTRSGEAQEIIGRHSTGSIPLPGVLPVWWHLRKADEVREYADQIDQAVRQFDADLRREIGWEYSETASGEFFPPAKETAKTRALRYAMDIYQPWHVKFDKFRKGLQGSADIVGPSSDQKKIALDNFKHELSVHRGHISDLGFELRGIDPEDIGKPKGPGSSIAAYIWSAVAVALLGGAGYVGFQIWKVKRETEPRRLPARSEG